MSDPQGGSVAEQLSELRLDHRRALQAIAEQEQQTGSLLEVVRVLTGSADADLSSVLIELRGLLDFDQAIILGPCPDGSLHVEASTKPSLQQLSFVPGAFFDRVLGGTTSAVFDVAHIPEWRRLGDLSEDVVSALHVPLRASGTAGMLVCVHPDRGHFGAARVELATKFAPIASQILQFARLRNELRRERDHLETRVEERTEQLQTALEQAQTADRAKSQFLANMSHEIRTPLNAVIAIGELLADTGLDASQRELVDVIRNSGENLLVVINDILDLSKIEAGRLAIEERPISVRRVVEDAVALERPRLGDKGLSCEIRMGVVPEHVVTDEVRLRQVLGNLLSNAVKFTTEGGVEIEVTWHPEPTPRLEMAVSDTGIGIPEAEHARLFKPFTQVDASTTRRFGGTGLGLVICRQLCEMLGGWIRLESEPGVGSTFRFSLAAPVADTPTAGGRTPAASDAGRLPTRVLLAEDNEVNRMVAVALLGRLGIEPDIAVDGGEAVEMAVDGDYEVVLMDIQMPVMDGVEATTAIRAALPDPAIRPHVIAVTANALRGDRERYLDAGLDDYLAKPLRRAGLEAALRRARRAPAPSPTLDRGRQVELYGEIADEVVRAALPMFIRAADRLIPTLEACRRDDAAAASAIIVELRGGAQGLGALAAVDALDQLELALATDDRPSLDPLRAAVESLRSHS